MISVGARARKREAEAAQRVRDARVVAEVTRRLEFKRSLCSLLFSIPQKCASSLSLLSPSLSFSFSLSFSLCRQVFVFSRMSLR